MIEGSDGALYGTACCSVTDDEQQGRYYAGTVFKLNRDGSGFTVLHRFTELDAGGFDYDLHLRGGVVDGKDGALYGTACCLDTGTPEISLPYVYRLNRDGNGFSVVRRLAGVTNGAPAYGLIAASDRVLYGATSAVAGKTLGTIFRIELDGSNYRLIHDFGANTNLNVSWYNLGAMIEGTDGALCGTLDESVDWPRNDPPAIFRLNKDGTGYQVLFRPAPLPCDGCSPDSYPRLSRITEGRDGFLSGVAWGFVR